MTWLLSLLRQQFFYDFDLALLGGQLCHFVAANGRLDGQVSVNRFRIEILALNIVDLA
jgi:hypothetical protein